MSAAEPKPPPEDQLTQAGFTLELTPGQRELIRKAHGFASDVIRPVAAEYDSRQEFPWPVVQEAAR